MAVFYIGTYDIVDPEQFKKYPPLVMALLPKYGGVVLASDTQAFVVEGTGRTMNAIIRFPSKEAALGLYNDPDYQEAKRIRQASTKNISMVIAQEIPGRVLTNYAAEYLSCAGPGRHNTVASTTTHSRNTVMLMRSHNPIHGVGRLAPKRGASRNVNPPNARSTTMLAIE